MITEVQAPNYPHEYDEHTIKVFLAGSIEMGVAENWQQRFMQEVLDLDLTIMNPRRDDWDSTWEQSIKNEKFSEQVNWELNNIESSDIVVVYFDPNTKSPITLLELGMLSMIPTNVIVCCPEGFWRKGNVEIVARRSSMVFTETFEDFVEQFRIMYRGYYG